MIGTISLYGSFILYLILYLPQLKRNYSQKFLQGMSFSFHSLLFLTLTTDLFYAFGRIAQWQYRFISVTMFSSLFIQHAQLFFRHKAHDQERKYWLALSAIIITLLSLLVFILQQPQQHQTLIISMGWINHIGYWSYVLPQFIRNKKLRSAQAISPVFLGIAIFASVLDTTSAWYFHWGAPSLYGAPISGLLHLSLLWQWWRYYTHHHSRNRALTS